MVIGGTLSMQRTQTICLVILATVAVGFSLSFLKSVLLPFVIALFVVIGCRPILEYFSRRLKLPRMLGFGLTFLIGLLGVAVLALLVWLSLADLARHAGDYEQRITAVFSWLAERFPSVGAEADVELNSPQSDSPDKAIPAGSESNVADNLEPGEPNAPESDSPGVLPPASERLADARVQARENAAYAMQQFAKQAGQYFRSTWGSLVASLSNLLSYLLLILIFVFFLLLGDTPGRQRAPLIAEIEEQIRIYLVTKTLISLATGFVFGAVLWLFGIPLAFLFGVMAFLLNYIPNIGPLVACALPVPFLVFNSQVSPTAGIICFVLISSVQILSGNVIETRIMGRQFDVSPVSLLLALMFFGLVWGIIGMFLATPIVSIVKIVLERSPGSKPIAGLMAGRLDFASRTSPG